MLFKKEASGLRRGWTDGCTNGYSAPPHSSVGEGCRSVYDAALISASILEK